MKNLKKLVGLCLMAVLLIQLTACGSSGASNSDAAANAGTEAVSAGNDSDADDLGEAQSEDGQDTTSEEPEVTVGEDGIKLSNDSSDFVLLSEAVPDAILEIRYYSTYNFVGDRIDGYEEPLAFLTKEAAAALREVSDELVKKGYRLKIYDAYRPQMAVTHFMNWALDTEDTRMKE